LPSVPSAEKASSYRGVVRAKKQEMTRRSGSCSRAGNSHTAPTSPSARSRQFQTPCQETTTTNLLSSCTIPSAPREGGGQARDREGALRHVCPRGSPTGSYRWSAGTNPTSFAKPPQRCHPPPRSGVAAPRSARSAPRGAAQWNSAVKRRRCSVRACA